MYVSRFGPQPFLAELRRQRWHKSRAADQINVPRNHIKTVGRGSSAPSRLVVERLAILLQLTPEQLFTPEALAACRDVDPNTLTRAKNR